MLRLALFFALTCAAHAEDLVGKRVPPFPAGMAEDGGLCITLAERDPCRRTMAALKDATGKKMLIYATITDGADERGRRFGIVTDVMPYPEVRKGHHLEWGVCRHDRVEDGTVVTVVKDSKRAWLKAVGWAYRVDEPSGKFVKLDPKRVDCTNTAPDAD